MSGRTIPAADLKGGDRIRFDFKGRPNRLGEVEVFDAYPAGRPCPGGHLIQLVLIKSDGDFAYRQVANYVPMEVLS